MENIENTRREKFGGDRNPRIMGGIILIIAGFFLLAYKLGAPLPSWLFTWPMILILIGTILGVKSRFTNAGAYIMLMLGGFFLLDEMYPRLDFKNYMVPAVLIGLGFLYVSRPKRRYRTRHFERWQDRRDYETQVLETGTTSEQLVPKSDFSQDSSEVVDINAVLGGVKKIILSKNFKGGEINCFMGGTELNLMKADILSPVVLEVNNVFGGTKLILPSNWDVKNEITAVFGGMEDKRSIAATIPDPDKVLHLKGTCVFGGIEISN